MALHNSLTGADIHVVHAFTYANAAARGAAVVSSTDIGKIAKQSDNNSYYVLINNVGPIWNQISNPYTAKGDLSTFDGANVARLGVGADGEILSANSAEPTGLEWIPSAFTPLRSSLKLITSNGWGSVNTMIRRFATVDFNTGSSFTYADSATLGMTVTINTTGLYAINYRDDINASDWMGVTLNSAQLTTAINLSSPANILIMLNCFASTGINTNWVGLLTAGDVVRVHGSNQPDIFSTYQAFQITHIGL